MTLEVKSNRTKRKSTFRNVKEIEILYMRIRIVDETRVVILGENEYRITKIYEEE